jgi:hypothetical protein
MYYLCSEISTRVGQALALVSEATLCVILTFTRFHAARLGIRRSKTTSFVATLVVCLVVF